jgi:hypothetical protein
MTTQTIGLNVHIFDHEKHNIDVTLIILDNFKWFVSGFVNFIPKALEYLIQPHYQ